MLFYLITYDVHCNKRRKKVSDLLEGYGKRVQYSVFECVLTARKYQELKRRLSPHINEQEDSLRFYPLSAHTLGSVDIWGGAPMTQKAQSTVA
jgi:CRISPR-associated protein Cas2